MAGNWEFFDHTADLGVRVTADTLPELFRAAGESLYDVIGRLETADDLREFPLEITADDSALLLRDYLGELLLLFDRDQLIVTEVEISSVSEKHLRATAHVATVDPERSAYHREVKAVTYHELSLRRIENGFQATFIVDI